MASAPSCARCSALLTMGVKEHAATGVHELALMDGVDDIADTQPCQPYLRCRL